MTRSSCLLLACILLLPVIAYAQNSMPAVDPASDAVGSVAGSFRVDEGGQATYRIPIAVTPGVAGMAPDLALVYSSQGGDGPAGLGWSIAGTSQIGRCRKTHEHGDDLGTHNYVGAPVRFSAADAFCLDGQRLLLVSGSYGAAASEYRSEQDPFTRVTAVGGNNSSSPSIYTGPASFRVERRDGTVQLYGSTESARLSITGCGGGTGLACAHRQWLLDRVEDSNGNFLEYRYARWLSGVAVGETAEADEVHLSEVRYTGRRRLSGQTEPDAAPFARVVFNYVARQQHHAGWQAGAPFRLSRELTGIGVYEPLTSEVRHYALEQRDAPSGSGRRLLHRVRECTDASRTLCYPATEFGVDARSHALSIAGEQEWQSSSYGELRWFRVGDIDGDGRQDLAWSGPNSSCASGNGVRVLFGSHTGFGATATAQLVPASTHLQCLQRSDSEVPNQWQLMDVDGDGRDDLLMAGANGASWQARRSLGRPATSTSPVFESTDTLGVQIPVGTQLGASGEAHLLDVNGDGLLDIVYPSLAQTGPGLNGKLLVRLGQIHRTGGPVRRGFSDAFAVDFQIAPSDPCHPDAQNQSPNIVCTFSFYRGGRQPRPIDLDGDGRGDLQLQVARYVIPGTQRAEGAPTFVFASPEEQARWLESPATTQGNFPVLLDVSWYFFTARQVSGSTAAFEQFQRIVAGMDGLSSLPSRVSMADVNGDGLMDFAFLSNNEMTDLKVRLNTGLGFAPAQLVATGLTHAEYMQWSDVDGDGRADLLYPVEASGNGASCGGQSAMTAHQPLCLRASRAGSSASQVEFGVGQLQSALHASVPGRGVADFDSLLVDLDGDGQPEFLRLARNVHGNAAEARIVRRAARFSPRDTLTSVTDGFGAETLIHYQPLTNRGVYRAGKDGWKLDVGRGAPVFDLLAPMHVVASVESSAPQRALPAARARTDYRYAGARMQSGGRGFLGFFAIDAFDSNEVDSLSQYGVSRTEYSQGFPYIGAPAKTQKAIGAGAADLASGVTASCRTHPESAADCFSPAAADWSQSAIGRLPAETGSGPRLHSQTINVYQTLEFGVPGSCAAGRGGSVTEHVEELARAGHISTAGSRTVARGGAAAAALQPVLFGTLEESFTAVASASGHSQLSLSFSAFCYQDGFGNLTGGFTDVRDPASDFAQRLHFTETASSFDNGQPLQSNQPWRLGRLLTSTVTKTMPSATGIPASIRKAHFSYDLSSPAKTGQLLSERVEVSGQSATRTLYTLDDYGNRIAAYVCSELEADGSALTDAECRDRTRVQMRPTATNGTPTTAVHRYTRTEFDARGRYPVRTYAPFYTPGVANELSERVTEEIVSRNVFGQVTHSRDTNGRSAYARFGTLGRPYASELQGGALGVVTLRLCGGAISCPPETVYRQRTTRSDGPTEWSYHDRLGQALLVAIQSFAAADPERNIVASCSFRDVKGRPRQTSVPFFLPSQSGADPSFSGAAADPCNLATNRFEQKHYDLIARPTEVIAPDASVLSFAYDGMTVIQTNALGQKTWETRNVLGQLVSEVQANPDTPGSAGLAVTHEYDAEGQRRFSRRNAGTGEIVSEQRFDALGRLSHSVDPDRGLERFEYNAAGEVIRRTDAGNQEVLTHYDAQGRMWKRDAGAPAPAPPPSGTQIFASGFESGTPQVRQIDLWQYDTAANGWGHLHIEERQTPQEPTFRRTLAYDSLGRASQAASLIEGQTRTESTTYDSLGRIWQQTDATGGVLEQVYTARGHVEQVRNGLNIGQVYNRIIEVNARGQVTKERRGDSAAMEVSRVYDAARGWLTAIDAGTGNGLQQLRYQFDTLGRLSWRHDQRLGQREDFGYDGLNRLRTATVMVSGVAAQQTLDLQYDALGNLCRKNGSVYGYAGRSGCAGSGGQANARPHAVTNVSGRAMQYDAQGRMTFKAGATTASDRYTEFNGLDQLVMALRGNLASPTAELQLNYTPGGARYLLRERGSAGLTTTRVYGNVEEVRKPNGTVETRRTLGGVAIETRTGSTFNGGTPELRYLFSDHLGSIDVIANASGTAVERLSFDPHGRRRPATDWRLNVLPSLPITTPRGFTGHEHLDAFGLVHMNGRVYDAELGRFLQPDPVLDAGIQGLNRYSYVLNNPLSLTDPSGYLSMGDLVRVAIAVAITVYTAGAAGALWAQGLYGQAFAVAAAGGFAAGAVQTGTLKGGVQGAFTAAAFFGVGSYFESAKWAQHATKANTLNTVGRVAKIVAHGATGGVLSDLQGGKFAHGFASAGFSEAAGPLTGGIQSDLGRGVAHALIGGTASKLSGGKFANGAVTGAMSFAFGSMARRKDDEGLGYNARKKSAGNVEYRTDMPEEFAELLRKHPEINAKMDSAMEASDQWGPNREHGFYGYTPDSGEGTAVFVDMPEAQFRWRSLSYGFIPYVPPPSIDGYTLQVVYHSHPFDVCFARCYPGQTLMGPSAGDGQIASLLSSAFHVIQQNGGHNYYYGPRALNGR